MPTRRSRLREAVYALLFVTLSACAGKSCSCISAIPGGFPVAQRHENAIQVRATPSLFAYLQKNGGSLVSTLLGSSTFNIPPSCSGTPGICCGTPQPTCSLSLDIQDLNLTPTAPSSLHLSTDAIVKTVTPIPITILGGSCDIAIDTTKATPNTMNLSSDLAFTVDKTTSTTGLSAANTTINLQSGAVSISGGIGCTILSVVEPIFNGLLASAVASQVSGIVGQQACAKCTTQADCNSFAKACTNGECMEADGTTCVPSLGIEGKLDLASLLASVAPNLKAGMDIEAVAGGYAAADTGLSIGLLGGALGDPHNDCVPMVPAPVVTAVPQSRTFYSDVLPDGATPFDVGLGIHVSELNTLGWGAFDAGALCLQVGTAQVSQLSAATLGIVMPSLRDLTHAGDAPMYIALHPSLPPSFVLGKGTFKTGAQGQTTVDDALLHVKIPGVSIDFYAWVDDRFVRVLTLNADLDLPLGIELDAAGTITPVFGDLSTAFTNVSVTNSALLKESPAQLAAAFPTALGAAIGGIAGSLKNIALPAVAGLQLTPLAMTSTDPDAQSGINQFLAIFANVAAAPASGTTPLTQPRALSPLTVAARVARLELPPTAEFAVTGRGARHPIVELALSATGQGNAPVEYAFSLDGGPWSPFSPGPELRVEDGLLWLQARHAVDVRVRRVGQPDSVSAVVRVPFLVDTLAPTGSWRGDGSRVQVDVGDLVTPAGSIALRLGVGGQYGEWTAQTTLTLPAGASLDDVTVQARDEAGNVGMLARDRGDASGSSGGCSMAGRAGSASPALLGIIVLVLLLMRRRSLLPAVAGVALVGAGGACGGKALGKGAFEDPADEIGRFSDLRVDGKGALHLSAYDDLEGDLVYTSVAQAADYPSWQVVDGVDLSSDVDNKGGYRDGILDPGPDVGQWTSLQLAGNDPRIAYYDATDHALKFALGPHPWKSHAVDSGSGGSDVGQFAALSLDKSDVPSIAYVATHIADGAGFKSELRVATAKSAHPSAAGDWSTAVVDSTPIACGGLCGAGSACITPAMVNGMANTDPSLSTCVATDATCTSACSSTQACIAGACTAVVAANNGGLLDGIGLFVNALRDSSGGLDLVYYDHAHGALKRATQSGGSWTVSALDGPTAGVDVGQSATATLGSDGTLHVAYADATHGTLLYKAVSGGSVPATAEVVDDGSRAGDSHQHVVGGGANIVLAGSGSPRIVYQDETSAALEAATSAGGSWSHSDLATGQAGFGFYVRQVVAGGQLYMSDFVYDRGNSGGAPLGSLHLGAGAP